MLRLPEREELLDIILTRGNHLGVDGVLLTAAFSQDDTDQASEIDILAIVSASHRYVQFGEWQGHPVEVYYAPTEEIIGHKDPHFVAAGAEILYDPKGILRPYLSRVEPSHTVPAQNSEASLTYRRWNLRRGLRILSHLIEEHDQSSILFYRNYWLAEFVEYLYHQAQQEAPPIRRRLVSLNAVYPGIEELLKNALTSVDPYDAVHACDLLRKTYAKVPKVSFAEADILKWD